MSVTALADKGRLVREQRALVDAMHWVQRGWTQGAYCRSKDGTACMPDSPRVRRVDLAWAVARGARDNMLPEEEVRQLVQRHLPAKFRRDDLAGLERWNDEPYRTRTEVVLLLERSLASL